jgi:hypothetical protein
MIIQHNTPYRPLRGNLRFPQGRNGVPPILGGVDSKGIGDSGVAG